MSKTLIQNGATERITLTALDSSKAGVTGIAANIDIVIRRDSNGDTWTGSAFSASFTTVNPTETDATNLPGRYHYDFTSDTNDITVTVSATTSDSSVDNAPWESGQIEVGGLPGNFEDLKITASTGRVDVGEWLGTAVAAGVGGRPAVDAEGISGSTTAADNVEANITNLNAAISTRSSHTTGDVYLQAAQALQDINLDHLMAAAVTGSEVIDNSALAKLVSASATADWDDFVNTTDSLQALRDRGDSAWATATGFASQASVDTIDTNVDTLITRVPDTVSLANINAQDRKSVV